MAYQYVREPLRAEEADRLCNACQTTEEKLVLWTLLDTGLRVSELCGLTPQQLLWQQKALRISGKGGPYGKPLKQGVVALPDGYRRRWKPTSPSMSAGSWDRARHKRSSNGLPSAPASPRK